MAETKQRSGKQSLVIYIGSSTVKGALVTVNKEGLPELSHFTRAPIGTGSAVSKDALLPLMQEALATLIKGYEPLNLVEKVSITLASPWQHAQIRIISSTSEKPIQVSERSVQKIIEKYRDEAPPAVGRADLEAIALQVKVNGYGTTLQKPVSGTTVRIDLYESEIDTVVRDAIVQAVHKAKPSVHVDMNSFPLASVVALRAISDETNFVVANVGGEITDLAVVSSDGIHYLASYPVGFHTIARAVAAAGSVGEGVVGDALSRLMLFAEGKLSLDDQAAVATSFASAFKPWLSGCEETLTAAAEQVPIPRTLFVVCDLDASLWIEKGIELAETVAGIHLRPTPLQARMVQNYVALGEAASYDMFLSLTALFFHMGSREIVGEGKAAGMVYS